MKNFEQFVRQYPQVTIHLVPDHEDGGWATWIEQMPGCISQGTTVPDALDMIADAMRGWVRVSQEDSPVDIWTDGSCEPNPGPGGWSYVIKRNGSTTMDNGGERQTTNNRMELTAVLCALAYLEDDDKAVIHTDSQLVIGWLSKGWRRKQPDIRKLCTKIDGLVRSRNLDVSYKWVKAHNEDKYNEMADKLAKAGIPR